MPPATHSSSEEDAFMEGLLSGLDDSFFSAVPSPDPSPVKRPIKQSTVDVDIAALVDGAENWDWDDMESDFLTPKKNRGTKNNVCDEVDTGYKRETCTRCIIERIVETDNGGRYEKVCIPTSSDTIS